MTPATGPCPLCRAIVTGAMLEPEPPSTGPGIFIPAIGRRHSPACMHFRDTADRLLGAREYSRPGAPNPVVVVTIELLELLRAAAASLREVPALPSAMRDELQAIADVDLEQIDAVIARWSRARELFDASPAMRKAIASAVLSAAAVEDIEPGKPGGQS